jgi:geranylgeranyl pyrophosphate synthase
MSSQVTLHPCRQRLRLVDDATQDRLLAGYRGMLPRAHDPERHLSAVVEDTLDHPGSLVRAQLAHATLRELGGRDDAAVALAVAIEYFHAASLLFDDMPAMDDAMERRGRACPHLVHGEAATTLAALGLINQGYALAWRAIGILPDDEREHAAEFLTECLGLRGILDGQSWDVHFNEGPRTPERALRAAAGKTVPLIRLTLVLPALVGQAAAETIASLESLSTAWGLAYQILDDFKDRLVTDEEAGKSCGRDASLGRPNVALTTGDASALERLDDLLTEATRQLAQLRGTARGWDHLVLLHGILVAERENIAHRLDAVA